jgi:hypothetical protein
MGYTGYAGDYMSASGCCDGATMQTFPSGTVVPGTVIPGTMTPGTVTPGTTMVTPQPLGEN